MPRKPLVVGLGEILWDEFGADRRPGGAPANVAFQAMQLGCESVVCTRVGDDARGEELLRFLDDHGLPVSHVQIDPRLPTGRVTVDTSRPGHPEFIIHENVAWDAIEFNGPTQELMTQAAAVCFGTLAQRSPRSRETIQRCLDACPRSCLKVFDVNLRQNWYSRETIEFSLQKADVFKLNTDEVEVLKTMFEFDCDSPAEFCEVVHQRFDVSRVCITRAEDGCLLHDECQTVETPGADVDVVDAVGAGDALTAALIFATLSGWPLEPSARFANDVGALTTTRAGAMPDLRLEFAGLIAEYQPAI